MRNAASEFQIVALFKMSFICIRIKKHFHINGFARFKTEAWGNSEMACCYPFLKNDEKRARFGGR